MNGGWASWSDYDTCSATCGGGKQTRSRSCEKPAPRYNGLDCQFIDGSGERGLTESEWRVCGSAKCEGKSFYLNPCQGGLLFYKIGGRQKPITNRLVQRNTSSRAYQLCGVCVCVCAAPVTKTFPRASPGRGMV